MLYEMPSPIRPIHPMQPSDGAVVCRNGTTGSSEPFIGAHQDALRKLIAQATAHCRTAENKDIKTVHIHEEQSEKKSR
jgi:hypothetical protein